MDRNTAMAEIKEGLSFRTDTLRDNTIIRRMKQAQKEMQGAMTAPWFALLESVAFQTVPDVQAVALPSPFWKEYEDELPHFTDPATNRAVFLAKERYDTALLATASSTNRRPLLFTRRNDELLLFPTPSEALTLYWSYYTKEPDDDFDNNVTDNMWLVNVPYLIIARAGQLTALDLKNDAAANKFGQNYTFWKEHLMGEIIEHEDAGRPRQMGSRH